MTPDIHATMHEEHRSWTSELHQWHEDLRAWQQQVSAAGADLKSVQEAFEQLGHTLRLHASALRIEEEVVAEHEHALAAWEQGTKSADLPALSQSHTGERDRQAKLRGDHEQLKSRQHKLFAIWNQLLRTLPIAGPGDRCAAPKPESQIVIPTGAETL
jgi:hypothetical protein